MIEDMRRYPEESEGRRRISRNMERYLTPFGMMDVNKKRSSAGSLEEEFANGLGENVSGVQAFVWCT